MTVPHAGIVYVLGAVNRPGGFVLSNDRTAMTTMKVFALAGGTTKIAKLDHAVIIRKDDQGKQTETEVDLKKVLAPADRRFADAGQRHALHPRQRAKQALLQAMQLGVAVGSAVAIYRLAVSVKEIDELTIQKSCRGTPVRTETVEILSLGSSADFCYRAFPARAAPLRLPADSDANTSG